MLEQKSRRSAPHLQVMAWFTFTSVADRWQYYCRQGQQSQTEPQINNTKYAPGITYMHSHTRTYIHTQYMYTHIHIVHMYMHKHAVQMLSFSLSLSLRPGGFFHVATLIRMYIHFSAAMCKLSLSVSLANKWSLGTYKHMHLSDWTGV